MNSMEINKIAAAVLTAGVVAMLLALIARILIPHDEVHGSDYHGPNLFADLAPVEATAADEPAGPEPIAGLLSDALLDNGARVAKKCTSCHSFEPGGPNKVGPNLANIVGAPIAEKDFAYSSALAGMDGQWDYEALNQFLYNPREYAPGTKMSFAGLRKPEDRAAVLVYMWSFTEGAPPLPSPQ